MFPWHVCDLYLFFEWNYKKIFAIDLFNADLISYPDAPVNFHKLVFANEGKAVSGNNIILSKSISCNNRMHFIIPPWQ